ncbi:MAG: carbohydrate ABC transporter permease, partial [Armatimonadota bacterium]|nr:carbohydrate ABC transporter permease [Armatimonadota bacterium]
MAPRRMVGKVGLYLGLGTLALFTAFPLLWLLGTALRTQGRVFGFPPPPPWPLGLDNFVAVWRTLPLPRFFLNTLLITGAGVGANLLLCAMAAYPLARMRFPGRNLVFFLLLATLMLPSHVGLIVNFVTLTRLSLIDTYAAVVLPSAVSVFGIFLLRQQY